MKQEILTRFPTLWMPISALLLFMALFAGFVIYAFFIEPKSTRNYKENIPLQDEETLP